jgi:hypothetical protein
MAPIANRYLEPPELQSLKNHLVAELFLRQGQFWTLVRRARQQWGIKPQVTVPANARDVLLPQAASPARNSKEWHRLRSDWLESLSDILIVVPFKYRVSASVEWDKFASGCVLYDPPDDTRLLEFAEYGNHYPQAEDNATSLLMSGLPIRSLKDGEYAERVEAWRWERLIDEVGRRYLEPRGLDIWAMVEEVQKNPPEGFRREYWEKMAENPHRYYIEPDEGTSRKGVERAWRLIVSHQQDRAVRPGQKERDLLVCLQLALLHSRYNEPDEKDPRRKRWSYPRLAERYKDHYMIHGLSTRKKITERAAAEHVKAGLKVLEAPSEGRV